MEVWRVENQIGEGPYTGSSSHPDWERVKRDLLDAHNGSRDHPGWFLDFDNPWVSSAWRAGFDTQDDLINWFGEFLEPVLSCGFRIVQVEAKSVERSFSGSQIRFLKG